MCRCLAALVVALVGSCVESQIVVCSNGLVCPANYTCTATGCVSPEELAACNGKSEGDMCTTNLGAGTCGDGACVVPICGDNVAEGPEACDDGNQVSGDGCNANCSSNETCGNGFTDLALAVPEECDGGTQCSATCVLFRCGNMVVDPGEVCDDGNQAAGDGCSAACQSDETCGNGVADYSSEECDDTNTRNRDGCSGQCRIEAQIWQELRSADVPSARRRAAVAMDFGRNRTVMFGGEDSGRFFNDTWEFGANDYGVPASWQKLRPTLSPSPRGGHAMAYDSKRGRTVMFGGYDGATLIDETWEFDGVRWTLRDLATRPPGRTAFSLTYDSVRDRIVLFGGEGAGGRLQDTWEYDGTAWTLRMPADKPPARQGHATAFDPARGVTVLFGGATTAPYDANNPSAVPGLLQDTWEYNGTNWVMRTPTANAPPTEGHTMVWHPYYKIMIYGGHRYAIGNAVTSEMWWYNGTTWALKSVMGTLPTARYQHVATFDYVRNKMEVFGGSTLSNELGDTHENSAGNEVWNPWSPTTPPAVRSHAAIAYNSRRGRAVMYGGQGPGPLNDTMELELVSGVWVPPLNNPPNPNVTPARYAHQMVYDAARDRIVMFGGYTGSQFVDETWLYDHVGWRVPNPAPTMKPSARYGHAMAYDSARSRVVLFGGGTSGASAKNDTWEWNGVDWSQITTANSPPHRFFAAMGYDAVRRKIVLFGGNGASTFYSDTWEYDGTNWTQIATQSSPGPRSEHGMAFDADSNQLILYGGVTVLTDRDDTWAYDGTTWTPHVPISSTAPTPGARSGVAMTYDAAQRRVLLFGGYDGSFLGGTWMFGYAEQDASEACSSKIDYDGDGLVGCADDECWSVCTPVCPPEADPAMCPTTPRCGDGTCSLIENTHSCPADCTSVFGGPICGDSFCDVPEDATACPADCGL